MNIAAETYTLKNNNKVEITFIPTGGKVISMKVPNASGEIADVVIGYDTPQQHIDGDPYFAAICGRFANRISKGQCKINGKDYQFETNDGPNHLHGGSGGFNTRVFEVEPIEKEGTVAAYKLSLVSEEGDQGYPGTLKLEVIYSLNDANEFAIEYKATTDKTTIINLTSHPYFNLNGSGDTLNHELQLMADAFTPINPELQTCDGTILEVAGTAMDFTKAKTIKEAVTANDEQVKLVNGLDHNFVINNGGDELVLAAIFKDPESGRILETYTDQPGIQVYTGNHFDGTETTRNGEKLPQFGGVALETQIFPNSPNCENFPSAELKPEEVYTHHTVYKFKW